MFTSLASLFKLISIMASKSVWDIQEDDTTKKFKDMHIDVPQRTLNTSFCEIKLNSNLMKGLHDEKFDTPNEIQKKVFEYFPKCDFHNLLIYAPCKTGKTSAILIAIINDLFKVIDRRSPYAIIIFPTYELAKNAYDLAQRLSKYCLRIKVDLVVKKRELKNKLDVVDILIGTPEKIHQLVKNNNLHHTKLLVIDEADNLLHDKTCNKFVAIKNCLSSKCNIILSFASKTKFIDSFMEDHRYSTKLIEIGLKSHEMDLVKKVYVVCNNLNQRIEVLLSVKYSDLYSGQTVIVCEKKEIMDDVVQKLKDMDIHINALSGALKPTRQTEIIEQFKNRFISLLLVTPHFLNLIPFQFITKMFTLDQILDPTTFFLNLEIYKKRESLLKGKKSLFINFIEKRWEDYLFQDSQLVNGKKLYNGSEIIFYENFETYFNNLKC